MKIFFFSSFQLNVQDEKETFQLGSDIPLAVQVYHVILQVLVVLVNSVIAYFHRKLKIYCLNIRLIDIGSVLNFEEQF